jgi:hypothetical protein
MHMIRFVVFFLGIDFVTILFLGVFLIYFSHILLPRMCGIYLSALIFKTIRCGVLCLLTYLQNICYIVL